MTTSSPPTKKIAFVASSAPEAQEAFLSLTDVYGNEEPETADVVVALGGDGLMLQTLHRLRDTGIPIYGMHRGSVGFLMNEYREDTLLERLNQAKVNVIHPLRMLARDIDGVEHKGLAINEVSMFRQTHQAARLKISIDGRVRMDELICDGVLVSTPAGSTAYNFSVNGPILPVSAQLLALTPISPFRPRRWRGALVPNEAHLTIDTLEPQKRPVSAVADHTEFRNIVKVKIAQDRKVSLKLMFDPWHALDERILAEQFKY
jgi:NAD+ kinase